MPTIMSRKKRGRTPLTKEMLLPMSASVVRKLSLENHVMLAALKAGQGNKDAMVSLLRVLYMTWFLSEKTEPVTDVATLLDVESSLEISIEAAAQGLGWQLSDEIVSAIEHVLLGFDRMISDAPKYRYQEAWDRLCRFVASEKQSPLPGSQLGKV
ncbi:hypothetical protein [Burkholderia cepacia]|uniref:hypothetical protein n=1 Tax=Burkholderia cepacia TaxID=292 RepID=UPI00398F85AE